MPYYFLRSERGASLKRIGGATFNGFIHEREMCTYMVKLCLPETTSPEKSLSKLGLFSYLGFLGIICNTQKVLRGSSRSSIKVVEPQRSQFLS